VCRLPAGAATQSPRAGPLHSVTITRDETSVICVEEAAPSGARVEPGFCALRVVGTFDLGVVGVLARLSSALAAAGVPLMAISTFDTDYLLVHAPDLGRAAAALRNAGVSVEMEPEELEKEELESEEPVTQR
jgi:hypothetical protein